MTQRTLSGLDRALVEIERALGAIFDPAPVALRPSPAEDIVGAPLDDTERRHAAGLMRVNHVGEVCAQALYFGQAAVADDERQRARMLEAAAEETDHLAWCGERLRELDSRPSLLNPLWYAGAYAIGVGAGTRSTLSPSSRCSRAAAPSSRRSTTSAPAILAGEPTRAAASARSCDVEFPRRRSRESGNPAVIDVRLLLGPRLRGGDETENLI